MYWKVFILFIFCLSMLPLFGQQNSIRGTLFDKDTKKPLAGITVLLKVDSKIIAFSKSNIEGLFILSSNKNLANARLEINHLGYQKYSTPVAELTQDLRIALTASPILLEAVEVKSKPRVRQLGDTLAYDVSTFANQEDRSIGDVLKRMPGIAVSETGTISYQGKPISHFYIDGDDLLENRYAIGTKTISHKIVQDIQVLNNHEHLKIMKNKRYTDAVAINLVIKEDAQLTLSGQAQLAAGLPGNYDAVLNSMLFNKKQKMLHVLQANNNGNVIAGTSYGGSASPPLATLAGSPINSLLNLGTLPAPPLQPSNYLLNNSAAINSNFLKNLPQNWQLKFNIQGIYEKQQKYFSGETRYTDELETVRFQEKQDTRQREALTAVQFNLEQNNTQKYSKNQLSLVYATQADRASITSNDQQIAIQRNFQVSGFSNQLNIVPLLKNKNMLALSWFLSYGKKPQTLHISPGVFTKQLGMLNAYDKTIQQLSAPTLTSQANLSYRIATGRFQQSYGLSLDIDKQHIASQLEHLKDGVQSLVPADSTRNDLAWLRTGLGVYASYEWIENRFSTQINIPINSAGTNYSDPQYGLQQKLFKWLFNPSMNAKYKIGKEDLLSFNYSRNTNIGNSNTVFRGYIVNNYRSISNNSAGLNEGLSNTLGLEYKMAKTVHLLFVNLGLTYASTQASAMLASSISNETSQTELIARPNNLNSYSAHMGMDKFIFPLATLIKLHIAWEQTNYKQLFNNALLPFKNNNIIFSPTIQTKIWDLFKLDYNGQFSWAKYKQLQAADLLQKNTFTSTQNLSFPINLLNDLHLRLSARHRYSLQPGFQNMNYLFFDSFLRYTHKKWRTDFELNISNIANIKSFEMYSISANMETYNQYQLRGRTAMLKAVFNFR